MAEKDPKHDNTYIVRTAGWGPRFAKIGIGIHMCGGIEDGISMDLCDCQEPNRCQWHPGGVISFEDFEQVYLAAKALRSSGSGRGEQA